MARVRIIKKKGKGPGENLKRRHNAEMLKIKKRASF